MSQKSLYMILRVDQVQKKVHLQKNLFYKQVVVNVSEEDAAMYEGLLEETSTNESLPFVEYDEERGVIG
ncbi:hypothetical protein IEE_05498 [Bacillus cereus BAG5X1-1]|uniref:Uncharacterized protein n=1 Tax=Bacillus cereus BAG5X1-1 TaxID=1053189 RepID=J7ZYM9_BACCE|nr:DUF5511 family protein [Bacillus cereus]EJQ36022.1 hypothetical protein IEE_05498 [Bacillus cereus BAG5X1-1]